MFSVANLKNRIFGKDRVPRGTIDERGPRIISRETDEEKTAQQLL